MMSAAAERCAEDDAPSRCRHYADDAMLSDAELPPLDAERLFRCRCAADTPS